MKVSYNINRFIVAIIVKYCRRKDQCSFVVAVVVLEKRVFMVDSSSRSIINKKKKKGSNKGQGFFISNRLTIDNKTKR